MQLTALQQPNSRPDSIRLRPGQVEFAVRCLGGFATYVHHVVLGHPPGRAARLFKFLLSVPTHAARTDYIAEQLWPEDAKSVTNLHAAAHDLRTWLGDGLLVICQRSEYSLAPCEVDADMFERQVQQAQITWTVNPTAATEEYKRALPIYAGPFLPEEPYADWVIQRRRHLEERFTNAAVRLATVLLTTSDLEGALEAAAAARAVDEAREDAVRIEMRALAALGRRSEALRRFARCKAFLQNEIGCQPDPSTELVRRELLG